MQKSFIIVLVFFPVLIACADIKEDFDIYLMIGQSNMAGRGEFEEGDTTEIVKGVYLLGANGQPISELSEMMK